MWSIALIVVLVGALLWASWRMGRRSLRHEIHAARLRREAEIKAQADEARRVVDEYDDTELARWVFRAPGDRGGDRERD